MKIPVAFVPILAVLVLGCATAKMDPQEGINSEMAYATGRIVVNGNMAVEELFFDLEGTNVISKGKSSFTIRKTSEYGIYKVSPGRYVVKKAANTVPWTEGSGTITGNPLISVELQPGKINYIGDIDIHMLEQSLSPGFMHKVQVIKIVKDNSSFAREKIIKYHPELDKNLDSIFLFNPAR